MVDPEIWMTWEAGYRAVLVSPAIRRAWESGKNQFTPAFQRHVSRPAKQGSCVDFAKPAQCVCDVACHARAGPLCQSAFVLTTRVRPGSRAYAAAPVGPKRLGTPPGANGSRPVASPPAQAGRKPDRATSPVDIRGCSCGPQQTFLAGEPLARRRANTTHANQRDSLHRIRAHARVRAGVRVTAPNRVGSRGSVASLCRTRAARQRDVECIALVVCWFALVDGLGVIGSSPSKRFPGRSADHPCSAC